ncbi:MAG TPA: beta-L-arabinofuranosidase domain-containing protein [archaeon]|nr:beta-L-arabinofuranosidase domain-containing protein [archaeon]
MFKRLGLVGLSLLFVSSVAQAVELKIEERSGIDRVGEPITCGVPLPEGWASSAEVLVLKIAGKPVPCEFRKVNSWPDGSLRWVHLDFQASVGANGELRLSLERGTPVEIASKLEVEETGTEITVTTGKLRAEIKKAGFNIFNGVWINAQEGYSDQLVAPHERGLVMWADGVEYTSAGDNASNVTVEGQGPMRIMLRAEGELKTESGAQGFHYICRLYFYNDSPVVRLVYTFENRGPYLEGREDKVVLEGLHVELPTAATNSDYYLGSPGGSAHLDFNGNDKDFYHLVPSTDRIIQGTGEIAQEIGNPKQLKTDRYGWIGGRVGSNGLFGMGLRYFWQMNPSSLEVNSGTGVFTAGLIPHRLGQSIDIYSGVARTHYLRFAFTESVNIDTLASMLAACQKPLLAVARPQYYCRESKAFGKVLERNPSLYPAEHLEEVLRVEDELDKGLTSMLAKVESRTKNDVTWESYGFLNWGDGMHYAWEPGVHEARNIAWNHHYYDLPHMSCLEFVRTGDYRWLDYFLSRAQHLMDVHVTHFEPGNRLNGANRYCPPTDHVRVDPTDDSDYTTARVYISTYTNHHKTQGLFERYYLTGDERSLEVALKAAEFASSFGGYTDFGQPRGAAFQVLTLIEAYQCTGDNKYLETARRTFGVWWDQFSRTSEKFTQGTFMVGFLLEAFINYYEVSGDKKVIDFVQQAVDWMRTNRPGEKYSNMALGIGFLAAHGKSAGYSAIAKEYLATWQGEWSNAFKDFGLNGRSLARALYYMSYEGLGIVPPPEAKGDINWDGEMNIADVIDLILKALADPADPAADFNGDGKYSIADAVSLLLYIREKNPAPQLAASSQKARFRLTSQERERLLYELGKLDFTGQEWESINALLGLPDLPKAFSLDQNHPNPFNPTTTISYAVPEGPAVRVSLVVYDLRGTLVKTLVDDIKEPGYYTVMWDGTDDAGRNQSSGVYFYRLRAADYTGVRKMVLVK